MKTLFSIFCFLAAHAACGAQLQTSYVTDYVDGVGTFSLTPTAEGVQLYADPNTCSVSAVGLPTGCTRMMGRLVRSELKPVEGVPAGATALELSAAPEFRVVLTGETARLLVKKQGNWSAYRLLPKTLVLSPAQ